MNEETPREAGDVPPGRVAEENPAGADPDTAENTDDGEGLSEPQTERATGGHGGEQESSEGGTGDPPLDPDNQGPSGPPHASIPTE
jgi:hypothetical protein